MKHFSCSVALPRDKISYYSYKKVCIVLFGQRDYDMRNLQLIRNNLIQMFAMRQPDILMKHQAVNDSQYTVYPINGQKNYPAEITRSNDKSSYQKKKDEGNAHRTHITRKAFGTLAEIEEAED